MKMSQAKFGVCATVICIGFLAASAGAANLIKDPGFKQTKFSPLQSDSSWFWYQINGPSGAEVDPGAGDITLTGGKTFLHSTRFPVKPGQQYNISVQAKGAGKVSFECLWWKAQGGMAEPHRTIPLEPTEVKEDGQTLKASDKAPEDAGAMYVRFVVEDGTVTLSQPSVTE